MELEFHELDRRYELLRTACRQRDSRVLASLDRHGQQLPVVVVRGGDDGRYILVDGYKRVRALRRLGHDTVRATCWDMPEDEALVLCRLMRSAEPSSALEQAWLLRELRDRFDLSPDELARRFDRSRGWVSERLRLVSALPEPIQEQVRQGRIGPHAAMKCLLPLSRRDREGAIALAAAIAPLRPSTRQTQALCAAWARGDEQARQMLLASPEQVGVHAREAKRAAAVPPDPGDQLLQDLILLARIVQRAAQWVRAGAVRELLPCEHDTLRRTADTARAALDQLLTPLTLELDHARRSHEAGHLEAS